MKHLCHDVAMMILTTHERVPVGQLGADPTVAVVLEFEVLARRG